MANPINTNNSGRTVADEINDLATDSDPGDPFKNNPLLTEQNGYCPITLMLIGEDNSDNPLNVTTGNRSMYNYLFKDIVKFRAKAYKMKRLLQLPIEAYDAFPDTLDSKVGGEAIKILKEMVAIPGIDAHEIVRFSNPMQIANARKTMRQESGSSLFRYLPNKFLTSNAEFVLAKDIIKTYIGNNVPFRHDLTRIQTIGMPTGMLNYKTDRQNAITIETKNASLSSSAFAKGSRNQLLRFHPNIFLIPGSLPQIEVTEQTTIDSVIAGTKFLIATKKYSKFVSYADALDWFESSYGFSPDISNTILQNHLIDHCLKLVLKVTTGVNTSEDTFRLNRHVNKKFVSSDGLDFFTTLLADANLPTEFTDAIPADEIDFPTLQDLKNNLSDMSIEAIKCYLGILECRLFTPEIIAKKTLNPRVFDRVFNFIDHPIFYIIPQESIKPVDRKNYVSITISNENFYQVFIDESQRENDDQELKKENLSMLMYAIDASEAY